MTSAVDIGLVRSADEIERCFECLSLAFGTSSDKPLFNALHPRHDTTQGRQKGIARLRSAWQAHKNDESMYYLTAQIEGQIAGFAVWMLLRTPPEGRLTSEDVEDEVDLDAIYDKEQTQEREWLRQVWKAYVQPRRRACQQGTVMSLELCAVHPSFQRRGVGQALTRWGIDEGKRLGAQEAVVEATQNGAGCYERAGFLPSQPISFDSVDRSLLAVRPFPSLLFMRTDKL